jgi:hypothetical protein
MDKIGLETEVNVVVVSGGHPGQMLWFSLNTGSLGIRVAGN